MHHERNGHSASTIHLAADAQGRLVFTDPHGTTHTAVEPVRAFPISAPRHGIALCDADGRQLHWIEALDALPVAEQKLLEDALARRQFVPTVRRILRVSRVVEPSDWEVETDRGIARFSLRSEEDVRRLAGHRALVTDAHGIRYLIPDLRDLDPFSSRILERYL
ncbi:MAG: DUF1854 domain-containing protein [Planctomycetia bacterium]|nr:DUF1854 domain-containing protein [Planctomycetia bacterium]